MDEAVENGESYYALSYAPSNAKFDGSSATLRLRLRMRPKGEYMLTYRTL